MIVKDKVIMITGGASGIGLAAAVKLANAGAKICICDINQEQSESLERELTSKGKTAEFFYCNVVDEKSIKIAIEKIENRFGRLDVAILNAGIEGPTKKVTEIELAEWNKVYNVNVSGLFLCAKHVIPALQKQEEGNIIITSSNLGMAAIPDHVAYCSSKGASIMLGKALAVDYRQENIRVNIVCPGPVLTPLVSSRWENISDPEEKEKVKNIMLSIPNLIKPEAVADTILFLASDASRPYSGETFVIDKGARAELAE